MVIDVPMRSRWAAFVDGIDFSSERARESLSLGAGVIALAVVSLVTLVVFRLQSLPIAGEASIGQHGAIASAFVAIVAFAAGRWIMPRERGARRVLNVLDVVALAVAHSVIALLTWTLAVEILDRALIGVVIYGIPGVILAGAMGAITAYVVFQSATRMRPALMARVLVLFFVEGVVGSMLAASDPQWWNDDFSALGVTGDASALTFNLTLIVAGLIITTLGRRAPLGIPTTHEHGIARVRLSLVVVGILLALVGALPADTFYWPHTAFAVGIAVVFGVLVILLPRWIPTMPAAFVMLGRMGIGILAVLFVLFGVSYYTLTAVELVAGSLILTWISLFIRSAAALRRDFAEDSAVRKQHQGCAS